MLNNIYLEKTQKGSQVFILMFEVSEHNKVGNPCFISLSN